MTLKPLFLLLPLSFASVACSPFFKGTVRFQDAQHGQSLPGTAFQLGLQSETQQLAEGRSFRTDRLSLVHNETGETFLISDIGRFLSGTATELTCQDCIKVLEANGKTYFLTRFHGGGSGSFYFHEVVELVGNRAILRGKHESCGQVFREAEQLTFPTREFKCPELFFTLENIGSKNVEIFSLSE